MLKFKEKPLALKLGLVVSVLMLLTNVSYIIFDFGDRTFSLITFIIVFVGIIIQLVHYFRPTCLMPLMVSMCYSVAVSYFLYLGLPTLSDVVNGVNFIGGNANAVILFGILFVVGWVITIVTTFMKHMKTEI